MELSIQSQERIEREKANNVYSKEFLEFIQKHRDSIPPLTRMEQELLQLLVKYKLGGFEKVVELYRNLTK